MIKKLLLSSCVAVAITGSALAADLPSRKAPPVAYAPPPPVFTWTGFYVGLNAGGTWAQNNNNSVFAVPGPCTAIAAVPGCTTQPNYSVVSANALNLSAANGNGNRSRGAFIGGGQIGFNYQVSPSFLVGFETDIQGIAGNRNNNGFNTGPITVVNPNFPAFPLVQTGNLNNSQQLRYLGTVRGRLGFLATPALLIYGTGGLAYGGVGNSNNGGVTQTVANCDAAGSTCSGTISGNQGSSTRVGYTVGGGLEWMFAPNWSVKAEYLYYDLRRSNNNNANTQLALTCVGPCAGAPGAILGSSLITQNNPRMNGHVARAGLNYHFNWGGSPAPVVARY